MKQSAQEGIDGGTLAAGTDAVIGVVAALVHSVVKK